MTFPGDDETNASLLATSSPGDNSPPMSVGELSGALKRTVESRFSHVRVKGEISGWKRHGSGHCYFSLKDEEAVIDAVLWRGQAQRLAFAPEDGAEVVATGKLSTYPGRSKYQLVLTSMELAGEGALMALLDKRRRAYAAEGLFDEARKTPLPHLPRRIGVVTSPTGAVIRDILHRLADRFPTHVIVWPVPVQGEGAAEKVAAAIRGFCAMQGEARPDLLIVARGGGSVEDLWAFNEDVVVRAAAEADIPLISAVGHETDVTLIDHVADRRAPTPTAAAEMAVPVRAELLAGIADLDARGRGAVWRLHQRRAERFALVAERFPALDGLLGPHRQRIDDAGDRLPRALGARTLRAAGQLAGIAPRLQSRLVGERIGQRRDRLEALWRTAILAHPDRPLARGYARVTAQDGRTLTSAAAARAAGALRLVFADDALDATVNDSAAERPPAARRPAVEPRRASSYRQGQADLFGGGDEGDGTR